MKRRIFALISFALNLALLILEILSLRGFLVYYAGGDYSILFRYYTNDSNILTALSAALLLPFELRCVFKKDAVIPKPLSVLKLSGTTCAAVTFFIVFVYLRVSSNINMYEQWNLYLHGICPVLAILSFCFFDGGKEISGKAGLLALLPSVVYAYIYYMMVMIRTESYGGWPDFYGFNVGGAWKLFLGIVLLSALLIATFLRSLHNVFASE